MKLGGTEKMPPKNNDFSELRGVAEVIEKMGMSPSFVGLVRRHNGMQLRLRTARTLLEKVSGGNVVLFLTEMLSPDDRVEFWSGISGRLPEAINDLGTNDRRAVIRALSTEGTDGA